MTTVRSLKLKNARYPKGYFSQIIQDRWSYEELRSHPSWGKDWISFDGAIHHAGTDRVYCGLTCVEGDIFYAWDRKTDAFTDLGFCQVMDRYDAKFHRSMEMTRDGASLYMATALLHDLDAYHEAPGGGLYRYDFSTGKTASLGIPIPHSYIQSIELDEARGLIYSMHLPPECMSVFDLATGRTTMLGPIGGGRELGQGENLLLDDDGCVWCGWSAIRAWQPVAGRDLFRLCKYDPHAGKMIYYPHGLPNADGSHGYAKVEGLFNFGTGVLYASGGNGSLYRIEPRSGRFTYLGTPIYESRSRLTSLTLHTDGYAYGVTGRDGNCRLLRFDPNTEIYELGDLIEDESGERLFQCHDITVTPDGVLYAAENDHPERSSYLWEITL